MQKFANRRDESFSVGFGGLRFVDDAILQASRPQGTNDGSASGQFCLAEDPPQAAFEFWEMLARERKSLGAFLGREDHGLAWPAHSTEIAGRSIGKETSLAVQVVAAESGHFGSARSTGRARAGGRRPGAGSGRDERRLDIRDRAANGDGERDEIRGAAKREDVAAREAAHLRSDVVGNARGRAKGAASSEELDEEDGVLDASAVAFFARNAGCRGLHDGLTEGVVECAQDGLVVDAGLDELLLRVAIAEDVLDDDGDELVDGGFARSVVSADGAQVLEGGEEFAAVDIDGGEEEGAFDEEVAEDAVELGELGVHGQGADLLDVAEKALDEIRFAEEGGAASAVQKQEKHRRAVETARLEDGILGPLEKACDFEQVESGGGSLEQIEDGLGDG